MEYEHDDFYVEDEQEVPELTTFTSEDILAHTDFAIKPKQASSEEVEEDVLVEGETLFDSPSTFDNMHEPYMEEEHPDDITVVSEEEEFAFYSDSISVEVEETELPHTLVSKYVEGDAVRKYEITEEVLYPHIQLVTNAIEAYHPRLINELIPERPFSLEHEGYAVYVNLNGSLAYSGVVDPSFLRTFFSAAFYDFEKVVYLDEHTPIEGELVKALCPPTL